MPPAPHSRRPAFIAAAATNDSNASMEAVLRDYTTLMRTVRANKDTITLDFPKVIVIGDQTSGKSSVLQTLVGEDMLPTATNTCTRVPLVITAVNLSDEEIRDKYDGDDRSFAFFSPLDFTAPAAAHTDIVNRTFDFNLVRAEVAKRTDLILAHEGKNGKPLAISATAIHVTIHSKKVVNFELTDLPGLIVTNNKDATMIGAIDDVVRLYAAKPNTIFLAFLKADQDAQVQRTFSLVQQFDPQLTSTIGVFTFVDRLTEANNLAAKRDALRAIVVGASAVSGSAAAKDAEAAADDLGFPLTKLGYVPVSCKPLTADEIAGHQNAGTSSFAAIAVNERNFFESSASGWRDIAASRCGTRVLADLIANVLMRAVKKSAGKAVTSISDKISTLSRIVGDLQTHVDNQDYMLIAAQTCNQIGLFMSLTLNGNFENAGHDADAIEAVNTVCSPGIRRLSCNSSLGSHRHLWATIPGSSCRRQLAHVRHANESAHCGYSACHELHGRTSSVASDAERHCTDVRAVHSYPRESRASHAHEGDGARHAPRLSWQWRPRVRRRV